MDSKWGCMSTSLLQSTLFLLIPLFSTALIVLALSHPPGPLKSQAILAYTYIASVTLLSTLAGALPLSHSSSSVSESFIQALLFLLIGIPVLGLAPTYVPHLSIRKFYTSVLVITLSIATLSALISPFLPTATPLLYISPSLFLLYTIQSIPRIAYILHNFLHPEDSIQINPITIPLTLPSPASTASFPFLTDHIPKHHHKVPSISTTSTITIVDRTRIFFPPPPPPPPQQQEQHQDQLRSQIVNSRSRSLLVFILAVQVAALAANACALGVTISASQNSTTLKTIQTACTVLALTGSMSAYLLHTYNLHLRQTPTSAPTTAIDSNYNNLSTHSPDQLQMIDSQQHHSNSQSPILVQLTSPPLPKARRKHGLPMQKNDEINPKGAIDSDLEELELELDVVMDIGRYSMTLGAGPATGPGKKRTTTVQDGIDLGLTLVSSPACIPVPAALPIPLPLRVSVEEGSRCGSGAASALEKEKIQEYYLCSPSSTSTGSPSSPFSPFERCGAETDPSSPDTPYPNSPRHPNTSGGSFDASRDNTCSNAIITNPNAVHKPVRKRSSFFGWEFAWDQEALERADDAGKLKSAATGGGASPVRWKSDVAKSLVDHEESFMGLGRDRESLGPSPPLSRPHSLPSEADVGEGGRMKSWRSVVGICEEKMKRKNTFMGMKPLRLSKSFSGTSGGGGGETGNGREMGHRTILSGETGPMCGLSLKRKTTVLMGGQRHPISPSAVSSRVMGQGQGNGDATRTTMITIAAATPATSKRLKKKTKPGHSTGAPSDDIASTSPSTEFEMGEKNSKSNTDNHLADFVHDNNQNLDSDNGELDNDADTDADLQKTPTMKSKTTIRPYSHSPQSNRYSSPNQQRHEIATSESHCSSINENCIITSTATNTTTTANTSSPQKLSPGLTKRGLSLKRSFKMGSTVGRTLGPGLTLSSAGLSCGSGSGPLLTSAYKPIHRCESEGSEFREEEEKRECEEKTAKKAKENLDDEKVGKEDEDVDVDVEAEIRSLIAARPVSASYARATPPTRPGADLDIGGGGGFASRSGGPVKYTAMSKSMLHSRPSLPIMSTTTTTAVSASICSSITEQYHLRDEHNSVFSMAASREPHPFADWFKLSETSTSRGDSDVVSLEQEMKVIRGSSRGNDDDRLSSLPLLPPLQPLLPPTTPPPQSQSLPPTPTKSRSILLGRPSISSFRKRSAPPALPPPRSSERALFPHPMSATNGMGDAAVSMVSLAHSRSYSGSRPPSQPPSRPTTPKPAMRLSAMNMSTVRSAFAGVGAKVSARMSVNSASTRSSAGAAAGNAVASRMGTGTDDIDGDFMDLRDPFASPPPSKLGSVFISGDHTGGGGDFWVSERAMSSLGGGGGGGGGTGYVDDDSVVGITRRISGKRRVNMNVWGRLPIPSTLPGSAPATSSASVLSLVANRKKAHSHHGERRKQKKEKRARKVATPVGNGVLVETNSSLHGYSAPCSAGEEDADFDVEEALLSQRLLRRLDSVEWD